MSKYLKQRHSSVLYCWICQCKRSFNRNKKVELQHCQMLYNLFARLPMKKPGLMTWRCTVLRTLSSRYPRAPPCLTSTTWPSTQNRSVLGIIRKWRHAHLIFFRPLRNTNALSSFVMKGLTPCPSLRDVIYECCNVCHSDPVWMRNIKCSFGSTLLLKII